MPTKIPFNIAEIRKKGIFEEDRFFYLLSEQNNYIDPKMVKDFYFGLVRLITKELRENGIIRLPNIGFFGLSKIKRKGLCGSIAGLPRDSKNRGVMGFLRGYHLAFYANDTWRKYFRNLAKKPGREGKLDPREKLLNQNLD